MIATLPMYDWPEVTGATDALWDALATALREAGFDPPRVLDRGDREAAWVSDELLVGQTCGLPFVSGVDRHATVVGTFDYGVEGCAPGDYNSVVVARPGTGSSLVDFRGRRVGFNGRDSQSGHAALVAEIAPLAGGDQFFGEAIQTGTHRQSIVAVASGEVDLAAVDAVSWLLALDHEPAAAALVEVTRTTCRPGLPLITSRRNAGHTAELAAAVSSGVDGVDSGVCRRLHIRGFVPRVDADYRVIADSLASAVALGYPQLV